MEQARSDPEFITATDDEVVIRTLAGEGEAFGTLWDRHSRRVYGYAFRRLGNREQAEDATAETFRRAFARLGTYRGNGFRSWLFAIAHNTIIDELRLRRPIIALDAVSDRDAGGPAIDDMVLANAEVSLVVDLLPRLTRGQRDVIELRLAGLAPAEIAQTLGKARPAIDMAQHRAVERLRSLLDSGGQHSHAPLALHPRCQADELVVRHGRRTGRTIGIVPPTRAASIEPDASIVCCDPLHGARMWLERESNATHGFFRTFSDVAAGIEAICSGREGSYEPLSLAGFKELDRSLDYLEGLSWTLFDRNQRQAVTRLRRAVRVLKRSSRLAPASPPANACVVCRQRLAEVDDVIGFSRLIERNGGTIPGLTETDVRAQALRVPLSRIAAARETEAAASACERAFAWYRVGAALRHGRLRNASRFLTEWLKLLIRRQ